MSELTTGYCEKTCNIYVSDKIRVFFIPYPGKAEPRDTGVTVTRTKGQSTGKQTANTSDMFTINQLGLFKRTEQT